MNFWIISTPLVLKRIAAVFMLSHFIVQLSIAQHKIKLPAEKHYYPFEFKPADTVIHQSFEGVLYHQLPDGNYITQFGGQALLEALQTSYAYHQPAVLSPDAVWLTILQGVAVHINLHAETLADRVLLQNTNQKETIRIPVDEMDINWPSVLKTLTDSVNTKIKKPWQQLNNTTFTTSSPTDIHVLNLVFLNAMERYFDYEGDIMCGIPELHIKGTQHDWELIRDRLTFLDALGLEWWTDNLLLVLDKIIDTYTTSDIDYLCSILKVSKNGCKDPFLDGWITHLVPYVLSEEEGYVPNRLVAENSNWSDYTLKQFPSGISAIKFTVGSATYSIQGGLLGIVVNEDGALEPKAGWVVSQN